MPDIEGDLDVDIDEKDLRIDTYRSSGAGGQHINKTSSCLLYTSDTVVVALDLLLCGFEGIDQCHRIRTEEDREQQLRYP